MALHERTRRWLMRLSAAVLLIAASLYVGLCLGRPLYYTDGSRELPGSQLAAAGMLQWRTPEAVAEVPGPVSGRVVALPDGRWCYGRVAADGTTDLVAWHPDRPAVPPEPLIGCNTEHNELAPALTADGRLWFASDRPGGAGGYDLYVVERWNAGAAAVSAVLACNTALDETDPTLPRDGSELVFVRSDRAIDRGNDGTLWHWQVGAELDPAPLYPLGRPGQRPVRRDPAFAADGGALWFVQKRPGELLELLRASRRGPEWAPPLPFAADWGSGELRAPLPDGDGRRLWLLSPQQSEAGKQLLYASSAHEVYPWWPGQRWLEWLLLGVIGTCLLLLLLLHFGRRWSALDLIAQCLLLSLLLHVLLFLWLMGVEISGAMLPGDDDGGMQVSVQLSAATAATAAGGAGSDVSATVQFTPRERDLSAAAPAAAALPSTAAAAIAPAPGEYNSELAPTASSVAAALADAPEAIEVERGVDAPSAQPAAAVAIEVTAPAATEPSAATARTASGNAPIAVTAPGSGVQRAAVVAPALAGTAQRELPAASESSPSPTPSAIALQDAPAESAPVAASASGEAPAAAVLPAASSGPVAPNQAAPSSAEAPRRSAQTGIAAASAPAATVRPGSALTRAAAATPAAPAAQLPSPRSGGAAAAAPELELRDAGAAIAAATPARAAAEPAAAGPVALLPAANAPARSQSAPIAASRQQLGTQPSTAPAPLPRPGSALVRGGSLAAGTAMAGALPAAPSGRAAVVVAPAVVDAPVAGAGPTARTNVPSEGTARPLAAAPSSASAPRSSAIERPVRRSAVGELAIAEARPTPPATRLPRPRSAPVAPGAAVVALPQASAYSNRFGPAKVKALEQFGGSDATERAVQNGLRYLARMQQRDGAWGDRTDYDSKYGFVYVGKSALCLLAFLGAGHTPTSRTEFSDHVQRGIAHLLALQDENGAFGPSSCYGHGIATYALAECYGLTKAAELVTPLERALTWILDHQGPRRDARNRGGWGYFSPGLQAEDSYARVSVSSWMIMALESARLSGVELPDDVLPRAREFLELAYDKPNGWFRYNHKPSRLNSAWPTLPASTPAAAFCLQLLGAPAGDPMVEAAVGYTVERRPQAYRRYDDDDFVLRGQGNVYFWYYGTLCCFLRGGDAWTQWNQQLRTVLPKAQAADGSFPPIDVYAEEAGDTRTDRSYTTAMCVLCLEVYYRYFTPLLVGR